MRKHDPGKPMEDEIDSDDETEEPEAGGLPPSQQDGAQSERNDSAHKRPSPVRKLHDERRNCAIDAVCYQYRSNQESNRNCTGYGKAQHRQPRDNAEDSGSQREQETTPPAG